MTQDNIGNKLATVLINKLTKNLEEANNKSAVATYVINNPEYDYRIYDGYESTLKMYDHQDYRLDIIDTGYDKPVHIYMSYKDNPHSCDIHK